MEGNFSLISKSDDLQDIFAKYGAFALEKQGNLAKIVGDVVSNSIDRFFKP